MDLDGATRTTTTTTTTATPVSTVSAEKSCVVPAKSEEEATSSGKNGSAPDSTVVKEKHSEVGQSMKAKDVPREASSPSKKSTLETANKPGEPNSKEEESKASGKQAVTTTTSSEAAKKVKAASTQVDTASSTSKGKDATDDDMENDDLLLRLEALERGEDPDLINVEKKRETETSHQNGLVEKVTEKLTPENQSKQKGTGKPDAGAKDAVDMPPSSTEPVAKVTSQKKEASDNPSGTNNDETAASKSAEAVSSNAKRKHVLSEMETSNEPQTKKVYIADVTDAPVSSDVRGAANAGKQSSPAKPVSEESPATSGAPSTPALVQMEVEKPPSVENMDVDGSPEPETSSSDNLGVLPDTAPNTDPEDKPEEISSSVTEEPTRSDSTEKIAKPEHSNVSSSDDKRTGTNEKAKPPDSEVSASVLPTHSEDEAMDVDEDEPDMAGSSMPGGASIVSVAPVPVVESPCVKKVAYLCTDDDKKDGHKDVKKQSASPAKPAVASTSAVAGSTANTAGTSREKVAKKVEVDSVTKPSSGVVAAKPATESEVVVVDSSNKGAEKPAEKKPSAVATVDEGVVESSQPSSSSDSKKQLSESRLNEQLRAAVHRSGLLAKASSTPNTSVTMASSSPLTPKTLNPVTTSAVSSSNVYSSTPIHANFVKVSSGNVSKITNPPSSVETSRVEADDTSTSTTAVTIDQSTSSGVVSEEKELSAGSKTSSTKSSPSVTPSKVDKVTATVSSVKSSPPKKELLKREESNSTSTSSLKTTDSSEVDSCTVVSAMNTAEEINMYTTNARKFNGISSTSDGSELDIKSDNIKSHISVKQEDDSKVSLSSTVTQLDLSGAISPSTAQLQQYEVSVWYEGKDLQFLSVERIHDKTEPSSCGPSAIAVTQDGSSIDSSSKQLSTTTNGSVSSLGPFSLPEERATVSAAAAHSSDSSSASVAPAVAGESLPRSAAKSSTSTLTVPQVKQTVLGPRALCDLIIHEFKKLRRTFAPDVVDEGEAGQEEREDAQLLHTPKASGSGRGQRGASGSTKKAATGRGQKRLLKVDDSDDEDDEHRQTPRVAASSITKQSAKKAKAVDASDSPTVTSTATPKSKATPEPNQLDICCLARWTDRKYYAGRVTHSRGENKFVVVFEDGCSKTLSRDIIVFGHDGILPILNHSIHALTGGDTYEPAIVEEIKRSEDSNEVVYAVRTASSALEVTATDIYLSDEQAKWIHNACKNQPDPVQQQLQSAGGAISAADGAEHAGGEGSLGEASHTGNVTASELTTEAGADKNARSTRSKRGAGDKSMTHVTPEAGYSGGVGKKGRRGRRKQHPPPQPNISEYSDASDTYEDEVPKPVSPQAGLDAVDGVQPELQQTEQESELARMYMVSEYFGDKTYNGEDCFDTLLGPIPCGAKTLFRNKHFLLSCTIPPKVSTYNGGNTEDSKYKQFSDVPFVKQHLRRQIEAGGGKVYQFFEDVPKNKYKLCRLIAARPSTTALYVQCLASDIPAISHEWIIQCCQVLTLVDQKPYTLPCGWSFLDKRFIQWGGGRVKDKRSSTAPFASISINVASLCKDFNDFWSRVCKLGGATVRLIKTASDVTENLTGYLLTDQEFPEEIKIKAARTGLLVVSTVWVVQCLIVGRVCHPKSHEKLTQIYQEDDY